MPGLGDKIKWSMEGGLYAKHQQLYTSLASAWIGLRGE